MRARKPAKFPLSHFLICISNGNGVQFECRSIKLQQKGISYDCNRLKVESKLIKMDLSAVINSQMPGLRCKTIVSICSHRGNLPHLLDKTPKHTNSETTDIYASDSEFERCEQPRSGPNICLYCNNRNVSILRGTMSDKLFENASVYRSRAANGQSRINVVEDPKTSRISSPHLGYSEPTKGARAQGHLHGFQTHLPKYTPTQKAVPA
jgi:hypothetical protein